MAKGILIIMGTILLFVLEHGIFGRLAGPGIGPRQLLVFLLFSVVAAFTVAFGIIWACEQDISKP